MTFEWLGEVAKAFAVTFVVFVIIAVVLYVFAVT